jgi:flagellar motor switch/type III secretory pathway protein FliN
MTRFTLWRPRESCRRGDLEATRTMRASCDAFLGPSRSAQALEAIVGARVDVELLSVRRGPPPAPLEGAIGLDLLGTGSAKMQVRLEVEADLAIALTVRALKRQPPKVRGAIEDADLSSLAGGLGAIVAAVSRNATGGPLRVQGAGSSSAMIAAWGAGGHAVDTGALSVSVDGEVYAARMFFSAAPGTASDVVWNRDRMRRLGETPLEVPIVFAAYLSTAAEVASLEVGDAWMLGRKTLGPAFRGPVLLAAPEADAGARADLVETGALVLRAGSAEVFESTMSEQGENEPIVEAVGDVPVVVRVELGRARMSAREWAALGPGDVVALAHKLAEPVTLRVGGVAVAEGELVDVEGEMGVRILRRLGGERAP